MRKDFMDMTIPELVEARQTIEAYIALSVGKKRASGATWADIGESLGVSMQEAHRRYRWHDRKPGEGWIPDSPVAGP